MSDREVTAAADALVAFTKAMRGFSRSTYWPGDSYLLRTPPYCPGPHCYEHWDRDFDGQDHHQPDCPMATTLASHAHNLQHAIVRVRDAVAPIVTDWWTAQPRWQRAWWRLRYRVWRWPW